MGAFRVLIVAWIALQAAVLARGSERPHEYAAAEATIIVDELQGHVSTLADDSLEGREAGTRGGRAAGNYLIRALEKSGLEPAGEDGGYVQPFGSGYRNIFAMFPGSDPELRDEVIMIGAHYDHVGYGNASNSYGPTGYIHNGADDNASGTSALLEIAFALGELDQAPARSIVLAFWDAEEKGLLGSEHWVRNPTFELDRVRLKINIDMIGRMSNKRLEVYGIRTAESLRQQVSWLNEDRFRLRFKWELRNDSDHYPFYRNSIPILMYHTGLHANYHRPSDDTERIAWDDLRDVARLTLRTALQFADAPDSLEFRAGSRRESSGEQQSFEQAVSQTRPSRLGIMMGADRDSNPDVDGVVITSVDRGGPAEAAGLNRNDRIQALNGQPTPTRDDLLQAVLRAPQQSRLQVIRVGGEVAEEVAVNLRGNPIRVGISWRPDAADPSAVLVTEVIRGSAAAQTDLRPGDRIYRVNGTPFEGSKGLVERFQALTGQIELTYERLGRIETVNVDVGPGSH